MKILFITQVVPFPVSGGESLRSNGLLKGLIASGHDLFVISPMSPGTPGLADQLPGTHFILHDFNPKKISRIGEFAGYFRRDKKLIRLIDDVIKAQSIELVLIDYFFLGQYIPYLKKQGIPVIYGTHNAQSRLRLQQPAIGPAAKMVRLFSFLAQSWHERIYFKRADHLICVSGIDLGFYRRFMPGSKLSVIPNFIDETLYRPSPEKKPYIIMTGNFESFQNYHGLNWFINHVWNDDLADITEFYLAGKGSESALSAVSGGKPIRHVKAIPGEDRILNLLASASAAIVPLWHGSGTRLKCIEAMALKTQLISTAMGAEGIDHGGSILVADTPELFRNYIVRTVNGEINHTEKAYLVFEKNYSLKVNRERLNRIVTSL